MDDFIDNIAIIFGAAFVGFIAIYILFVLKAKSIARRMRSTAGFTADDVYVSAENLAGLAVDRRQGKIMLSSGKTDAIIPVSSLIDCELWEGDERLELRLTTDDFDNPSHKVVFLAAETKKGINYDGVVARQAMADAERWYSRMKALIALDDRARSSSAT